MLYIWMAVAILTLSGGNILSGFYGKKVKENNVYVYTLFSAAAGIVFFIAANRFSFAFHLETFLFAMLFAFFYLCAVMFYILALKRGPLSVTALIYAYALVVPTLFGIFFYHDPTDAVFYIALVFLLVSLFLINVKPKNKRKDFERPSRENEFSPDLPVNKKKNGILWGIFIFIAFLGNGLCSVVQSYHQRLYTGTYKSEFMIFALFAVMLVNLIAVLCITPKNNTIRLVKKNWYWGVIGGIVNALLNLATMMVVAGQTIPLSWFFPFEAACNLVIVYLFSLFVFKEKLGLAQHVGFACGVISIILFNI